MLFWYGLHDDDDERDVREVKMCEDVVDIFFCSVSFTFGSMIGWGLKVQAHTGEDCTILFSLIFGDDNFFREKNNFFSLIEEEEGKSTS